MLADADIDKQFKYVMRRPDMLKVSKLLILHQPNPNSGAHDYVATVEWSGVEWEEKDVIPFARTIARAYLKKIKK